MFKIADDIAPNLMDLRSRNALIFHQQQFEQKLSTQENYETTALVGLYVYKYVEFKGNSLRFINYESRVDDKIKTSRML